MRRITAFVCTAAFAWPAPAAEVARKDPRQAAAGTVFEWQSQDGLAFRYRLPHDFDRAQAITLTFVLHGSNLDRRWGFANHTPARFRPDDLVVCPDGTTPNGTGGCNFLGEKKDVALLAALHRELMDAFQVRATYLYGHSQGSFFALHYAGEFPDAVLGVVAHASGIWSWTKLGKAGHHQAIVLMHGTQDPVVPYASSAFGHHALLERKYPLVRLRALEGWNHWPAEHNVDPSGDAIPHTSQQLAWCEGVTTRDAQRAAACLDVLSAVSGPERHDHAALYGVAARIAALESMPEALRARAAQLRDAVEELAAAHAQALTVDQKGAFDARPWIGHLPLFLRAFAGVPACDSLRATHAKLLERQDAAADKHLRDYHEATQKSDFAAAFKAGGAALSDGFLSDATWDRELLANLETWRADAKAFKLDKKALQAFDAFGVRLTKARAAGVDAFDGVQRKHGRY